MATSYCKILMLAALATLPLRGEEEAVPPETGISGAVADGTPVPPAPKPEVPDFTVTDSTVRQLPDRSVVFRQVVPPNLPAPPVPLPPVDVDDPAAQARLSEMQETYRDTVLTFVSATVYDHKKTFIRWWPNGGAGKEIAGWSNLDWNHLCGFATYFAPDVDGEIREHALLMGIGNEVSDQMNEALSGSDQANQTPQSPTLPDLSTQGPAFVVTEGDSSDAEAMAVMTGLHELYRKEGERLRLAWLGREEAAKKQAEFLRLHPPIPEDTVIHFWPRKSRRHSPAATPSPISR